MPRRWLPLAALALLTAGAGSSQAGWFTGPWDLNLGAYNGGFGYSYNYAYSYGLPLNSGPNSSFAYWPYERPYRPYVSATWANPNPNPNLPYVYPPPVPPPPFVLPVPRGEQLPPPLPDLEKVQTMKATSATAEVAIRTPADAEVWVDKEKLKGAGPDWVFRSEALPDGEGQMVVVRVRWTEGGRTKEQMRVAPLHPGDRLRVRLPPGPVNSAFTSAPPPSSGPVDTGSSTAPAPAG